jgi:MFS family permease
MARRGPHPLLFAILIAPYGAAFSYVGIALPFLAVKEGVEASAIGTVVALSFVPHTWKFLWAPVVDTTLTRKAWYWIALALTCGGIVAASSIPIAPSTLPLLTAVVMTSQIGLTLINMAGESFLALAVPEEEKGRAAGWYNAGIYAGSAVGGWAFLRLAGALPEGWMAGAVVGGLLLLCGVPALFVAMPPRDADHPRRLGPAMRGLLGDLKELATSRLGLSGLIICISPVGAGAVVSLLNATAASWGVVDPHRWSVFGIAWTPEDVVGLVNGLVGGLISAVGALAGGWLADRLPRRLNYALAGGLMALAAVAMAVAPRTPAMYVLFGLIYAFFMGVAFAAFSGFVLETIGKGAVATKYNVFASLANVSIAYVTYLDGQALRLWGTTGMLLADAALTGAGIALLLAMVLWLSLRSRAA